MDTADMTQSPSSLALDERADAIVTQLYRRFKDWSKRGFGPDDVTWCEVKADIAALLSAVPASQAVKERPLVEQLTGALRFILAFYEPGQTYLDTEAWKHAEAGGRAALARGEAAIAVPLIAQEPAEGAAPDYAALLRELELWEATAKASEHRVRFWQDRTEASEARARRMEEANAKLRRLVERAQHNVPLDYKEWHTAARAALYDSPAPAKPEGAVNAELLAALRHECAKSGMHDHDGCSCSDAELLRSAALSAPSPREGWVTAARNLLNEIGGLRRHEREIREAIGNTNWTVLDGRASVLEAALSAAPSPQGREGQS